MKRPFLTKEALAPILAQYPTPFHIYDQGGIRGNMQEMTEAFSWNKGFKEYFAVKANPNPTLLKVLRQEGCGVDCSSYTELLMAQRCGFSGHEIMFSSNQTPKEDYQLANQMGAIINLDDITHIDFLKDAIGTFPTTMSCRYNPGGTFQLGESGDGPQVMDSPGDAKYGLTRPQMTQAFLRLKELGVEHFGIHGFWASNTMSNEYYPTLARHLFTLAVELKAETGCDITFINLSGGVGIPYRPGETPNDMTAIAQGVQVAFEEILVPAGMGDIAICSELGRYIMGPFGGLVTTAIHAKHTHKEYIGVDACAVHLMRPAMYGSYHHITVMGKEDEPCDHVYDVVGGLCENNDKFAIDRPLPAIENGDVLFIHDTGAHGSAMGYHYNGKLHGAELLYKEDGTVQLIRRKETPEDYFATLIFEP